MMELSWEAAAKGTHQAVGDAGTFLVSRHKDLKQYVLEHNRRNPPSEFLIQQFAQVLDCPVELLYYCAGELQPDTKCLDVPEEKVVSAYQAFQRALEK